MRPTRLKVQRLYERMKIAKTYNRLVVASEILFSLQLHAFWLRLVLVVSPYVIRDVTGQESRPRKFR